MMLSGFSRRHGYPRCQEGPEPFPYCRVSAQGADFPAPLSAYALQPAIPSAGGGVTPASPRRSCRQCRNVHRLSICLAFRLIIRDRLTPGRLTSPGNPWPCGGGGSRPPYRYLCLHLLFLTLHRGSRLRLRRWTGMLPYRCQTTSRGFGAQLHTRLLSMPDPSTSELLRTLWMNGCFQANMLAVMGKRPR